MRFRCLKTLNDALLLKQQWRLCKHPDSSITKTMKAKYFNNSSILEARAKSSDSYAWMSLPMVIDTVF